MEIQTLPLSPHHSTDCYFSWSSLNPPFRRRGGGSSIFTPRASVAHPLLSLAGKSDKYLENPKMEKVKAMQLIHPLEAMNQCTSIMQLKQIHAYMLRTSLFFDHFPVSKFVSACALSSFSSLNYAHKVFEQIPQPNLYLWNTLIRAYASSSVPTQSLLIFLQMLCSCPEFPNEYSYPFVIKAASELRDFQVGRVLHGMAIKCALGLDLYILNSLIHFYGSCGKFDLAHRVFSTISKKDVVSWNSLIYAFAQGGYSEKALLLFKEMEMKSLKPNNITMVVVLSACSKKSDLEFGRWIVGYIKRNNIDVDLTLNNKMLDMYVKCGSMDDAINLFNEMTERDIVSWTTILHGYAKLGKYDEAQLVFDAMPHLNIAAWNALISAYEQNGRPKDALSLFHGLQFNESVKPDAVTLVCVLSACAQLGAMDLGGWIHVYIKKNGIKLNCHLTTSLIDMYAKCGDLHKALEVFHSVERKDVYVWSAMIGGLAMHGHGKKALDLFSRMLEAKVGPNAVTFTNVLCACSHTGLVDEGKNIFHKMEPLYGVVPRTNHYACMVDILGRAGLVEEAVDFIENMAIATTASVWGALLGACKLHGKVDLAERACNLLIELDPGNHGAYVLLSNIYAKAGKWDKVSFLRKVMRDSGLKKEPGGSSIEVNGIVHEFLVGDSSHPLSPKIYSKLEEILLRLKSIGYEPKRSQLLQLIEEDEAAEHALSLHSEKLAIAFGLISTGSSHPIRIVKNLRICEDCHSIAKLVSALYDREILLRDCYRFHHFKEGKCSCMDYW